MVNSLLKNGHRHLGPQQCIGNYQLLTEPVPVFQQAINLRIIGRIALCVLLLLESSNGFSACPYCPTTDATLSEKLAQSDVACVVKFLDAKNGEELSMQTTTFEVVHSLKANPDYSIGKQLITQFGVTGEKGNLYILIGQKSDDMMDWKLPIPIDELGSEVTYLRNAPSPELPQAERLAYFLKFLDHKNSTISNDALGEFSRATFEDVEKISPKFSRKNMRKCLEDPDPQLVVRRRFYSMLLGFCGNDDDANFLEKKILAPVDPTKNSLEVDGMFAGYLMLRGQNGLKLLIQKLVDPDSKELDESRTTDLYELRKALSFLWDYRRSQFTEEVLRSAMRKFLDYQEFAELAIVDLARWKDWNSLEQLIAAYGSPPWETQSGKEKIVLFALVCQKEATGEKDRKYSLEAGKFLESLDRSFVDSIRKNVNAGRPQNNPKNQSVNDGRS